jgi:four helix bundle protein
MDRSLVKIGQLGFENRTVSFELLAVSLLRLVFMKDFKKLLIWQKAMEIVAAVYKIAEALPLEEKYGLRSQIARCSVSVAANIAEGSSRGSERDYRRFVEIALGSCFELETHCLIIVKLGLGDGERLTELLAMIDEEQKMLTAFIKTLNG